MRSRDQTVKKNKPTQSGVILLVTGISIMFLGVAADSLHIGRPSFGLTQLSVVIVGRIVTLSGLRKLIFPSQAKLDGVLLAAYFLGLLFMGIEPKSFKVSTNKYFLYVGAVSLNKDFLINVLGFLPFGYLVMSYLLDNYCLKKMRAFAVVNIPGGSLEGEVKDISIGGGLHPRSRRASS